MSQSNKDSEPQTIEASVVEIEQIRPSAVLKSKPQFSNSKAKASQASQSSLALSQDKNKSTKIIRTSMPKVNYKPSQYSVTQHTQNSGRASARNSLYNGDAGQSQKRFVSPSPTLDQSMQSSSRQQTHLSNLQVKGLNQVPQNSKQSLHTNRANTASHRQNDNYGTANS